MNWSDYTYMNKVSVLSGRKMA